jgi:predicted metal-dependent hydrolase
MESVGPEKEFFQGLIMACAAFVHLERGNPEGCVNLLENGLNRLEQFPPRYMSFPVREFVDLLATWQAKVELMRALHEVEFNAEQLPLIHPPEGAMAARLI